MGVERNQMNQSVNHEASCDRTTAHAMRSSHPAAPPRTKDKGHVDKREGGGVSKTYLFQRHDAHQLPNTGDIGVTEAQQGEQSVCLSGEGGEHDPVSVQLVLV